MEKTNKSFIELLDLWIKHLQDARHSLVEAEVVSDELFVELSLALKGVKQSRQEAWKRRKKDGVV